MPISKLKPFWQSKDKETVKLFHGDVIHVLNRLPAGSVQMVVTSPPYWGLRDYGTGTWEGGSSKCDHSTSRSRGDALSKMKSYSLLLIYI